MESLSRKFRKRIIVFLTILVSSNLFAVNLAAAEKSSVIRSRASDTAASKLGSGEKVVVSSNEIERVLTESANLDENYLRVAFSSSLSDKEIDTIVNNRKATVSISKIKTSNFKSALVKVNDISDLGSALKDFNADPKVLIAEPVYKRHLTWTPNDLDRNVQWQLDVPASSRRSIDIEAAWDIVDGALDTRLGSGDHYGGDPEVVVAVLDSGLAFESWTDEEGWNYAADPEGPVNLWRNEDGSGNPNDPEGDQTPAPTGDGCPGLCGVDDDGDDLTDEDSWGLEPSDDGYHTDTVDDDDENGFNDDLNGVDIFDWCTYPECGMSPDGNDGHPNDNNGHGTLVSNIIAANTNNGTAGVGIAPNVSIMPIKVANSDGAIHAYWLDGLTYALENGADIVNMSFAGPGYSAIEEAIMSDYVNDYDAVLVAASGNYPSPGVNHPSDDLYPASYADVISVGASNEDGGRSSYSVYGGYVDLVAPVGDSGGYMQQSYSCYFSGTCSNTYNSFSYNDSAGTSFAAPQVSAAAALIKSVYPDRSQEVVRYMLWHGAMDVDGYSDYLGFGVMNVEDTLNVSSPGDQFNPVYRFWSDRYRHHFYTISESEKDYVVNNLAHDWEYENIAYYTSQKNQCQEGMSNIYRFWSDRYRGHFYTISESEKDHVINNLGHDWEYEGIAFCGYNSGRPDAVPLYRFWSDNYRGHFYTKNESEKNYVIGELSHDWEYEGIAYYIYDNSKGL
jgi:subtilisin family serine protease